MKQPLGLKHLTIGFLALVCTLSTLALMALGISGCNSGSEPGAGQSAPPAPVNHGPVLNTATVDAVAALDGHTPYEVATGLSVLTEGRGDTLRIDQLADALDLKLSIQCEQAICHIQKK